MSQCSLSIMGSTGSIGCSTLAVVEHANAQAMQNGDEPPYRIEALAGGANVSRLIEQAEAFRPAIVVISDETKYADLKSALAPLGIEVAAGDAAIVEAAGRPVDRVMAAIVGVAGLASTLAAIQAKNDILLANKESMICASQLIKSEAAKSGAQIIPVDSEHNAMFQVMERREDVEKLILTASGGPFLDKTREEMASMTAKEAVAHPRWSMGVKISIDSASLMNKALELIEAAYLFDMPQSQIDVVVHPQSIIHSLVAYRDGSVLAQLGTPDMKTPIAHALAWPKRRLETAVERLNLAQIGKLDFADVDHERFPAITLARSALDLGGAAPAILNCANEAAVAAFMRGECGFLDISWVVEEALQAFSKQGLGTGAASSLSDVQEFDAVGSALARELVSKRRQREGVGF